MSVKFDNFYVFQQHHLTACNQDGYVSGVKVDIVAAGPERSLSAHCNVCGTEFRVALSIEDIEEVIEIYRDPKTLEDAVRMSRRDVH